jgi:hypothetical protein
MVRELEGPRDSYGSVREQCYKIWRGESGARNPVTRTDGGPNIRGSFSGRDNPSGLLTAKKLLIRKVCAARALLSRSAPCQPRRKPPSSPSAVVLWPRAWGARETASERTGNASNATGPPAKPERPHRRLISSPRLDRGPAGEHLVGPHHGNRQGAFGDRCRNPRRAAARADLQGPCGRRERVDPCRPGAGTVRRRNHHGRGGMTRGMTGAVRCRRMESDCRE